MVQALCRNFVNTAFEIAEQRAAEGAYSEALFQSRGQVNVRTAQAPAWRSLDDVPADRRRLLIVDELLNLIAETIGDTGADAPTRAANKAYALTLVDERLSKEASGG